MIFSKNDVSKIGQLRGKLVDAESKEAVSWAAIIIVELNRTATSHNDGTFSFQNIPFGSYTLKTLRLGYNPAEVKFSIGSEKATEITIYMVPSHISLETVIVTANDSTGLTILPPTKVVSGKELRQNMGRTLAETLSSEPGLGQRTMGPAPARPVMRGLGGDRLLILQDGERTGDLSATSADHALTVEPLSAERIEIIRGAGALLYGSNTIGGVINVVKNDIQQTMPDHIHGTLSAQGESVNQGISGAAYLWFPVFSQIAGTFSFSRRVGEDIQTPFGKLKNTAIRTESIGSGMSWITDQGMIGVSGGLLDSKYGIPGGFLGGHPNGVNIEMSKQQVMVKSHYYTNWRVFTHIETNFSHQYYQHKEFEAKDRVGAKFALMTDQLSLFLHHSHTFWADHGTIGLWIEQRDYYSGGLTFTPPTIERTFSTMVYESLHLVGADLEFSARIDIKSVYPEKRTTVRIGELMDRTFFSASGGITYTHKADDRFWWGGNLLKTSKSPGIEELFSDGPHLAAYSFEIGNPKLEQESAIGIDFFTKWNPTYRWKIEASVYWNHFFNYIYSKNTNVRNNRLPDLFNYQFTGAKAYISGYEFSLAFRPSDTWTFGFSSGYAHGTLLENSQPLPEIPPLNGKLSVAYQQEQMVIGTHLKLVNSQNRNGEFEQPTAGYVVWDIYYQQSFPILGVLNSLDITVENVLNTEYRNHLSRVKSIMPESGLNFKLMVKTYF